MKTRVKKKHPFITKVIRPFFTGIITLFPLTITVVVVIWAIKFHWSGEQFWEHLTIIGAQNCNQPNSGLSGRTGCYTSFDLSSGISDPGWLEESMELNKRQDNEPYSALQNSL